MKFPKRTAMVASVIILALSAIGGVASYSVATQLRGAYAPSASGPNLALSAPKVGPGAGFSALPLPACAQQTPDTLATVALLAPGHRATELSSAGYGTAPALVPLRSGLVAQQGNLPLNNNPSNLIILRGSHGNVSPAALADNPAIQRVADLLARSAHPDLVSCDHQLSDKPAAQALIHKAQAAIAAAGLVTQVQLADASTVYYISDDPFNADREYVSAVLAKPIRITQISPTQTAQDLTPVVAYIDRQTGRVLLTGWANWFAGE